MKRRTVLAGALAGLAAACTPSLGTFNRLVPHDPGAGRVLTAAAYGEGPRRTLDVYAPSTPAHGEALPIIVFFYGGSWSSGAKEDYGFVGDALAARGFLTIIPDYRIAPDVFPSFMQDAAAALAWVREHATAHGGDPNRIVLVGHSAGAYIAVQLALDTHFLRDAGVDPSAIVGVTGISGPYDFLPLDVPSTRNAFGHVADLATTQPGNFARADAPPLLLLWGEDDDLVGRRNIEGLTRAMRAAGAQVDAKTYPNLGHAGTLLALARPLRGRAPVLDDVTAFAQRVA